MNSKIILGFVGPLSSGKGTAAKYLKEKHQAQVRRFSSILRDVLDRLFLEQSRDNMQNLSLALRQTFGQDLLAKVIAQEVENLDAELIVVDGIRRQQDIKYLRDVPGFHLVHITAEQKIRWQRLVKRGENRDDANKTFKDFQADEQKEAEQHIKEVAKEAKFEVDNNGTVEELYGQIEDILNRIMN